MAFLLVFLVHYLEFSVPLLDSCDVSVPSTTQINIAQGDEHVGGSTVEVEREERLSSLLRSMQHVPKHR
jgi:hypothetical protein